jgi:DNA mismatch endonuclease, patch repair protein
MVCAATSRARPPRRRHHLGEPTAGQGSAKPIAKRRPEGRPLTRRGLAGQSGPRRTSDATGRQEMSGSRPTPSGQLAELRMKRQARMDTAVELAVRRALHRRGLRYRLQLAPLPGLKRRVDIALVGPRIAVDVRGCFWHACPEHGTHAKANAQWWADKLRRNVERDADTERRLAEAGWQVVVVWEHEDPEEVADRVEALVRAQGPRVPR